MADSKNIDGRGPYEAIGKVIRKLPVKTKVDGGTHIEVGFPVCEVTEYLDEHGAKAVAQLMNRGDVFEELLTVLKRVSSVVNFNGTCHPLFDGLQVQITNAISRAEGRS